MWKFLDLFTWNLLSEIICIPMILFYCHVKTWLWLSHFRFLYNEIYYSLLNFINDAKALRSYSLGHVIVGLWQFRCRGLTFCIFLKIYVIQDLQWKHRPLCLQPLSQSNVIFYIVSDYFLKFSNIFYKFTNFLLSFLQHGHQLLNCILFVHTRPVLDHFSPSTESQGWNCLIDIQYRWR